MFFRVETWGESVILIHIANNDVIFLLNAGLLLIVMASTAMVLM